jgi:hypothetical protein
MANTFWAALETGSLAANVATIGIYVIRGFERWVCENTIYFICLAAAMI